MRRLRQGCRLSTVSSLKSSHDLGLPGPSPGSVSWLHFSPGLLTVTANKHPPTGCVQAGCGGFTKVPLGASDAVATVILCIPSEATSNMKKWGSESRKKVAPSCHSLLECIIQSSVWTPTPYPDHILDLGQLVTQQPPSPGLQYWGLRTLDPPPD